MSLRAVSASAGTIRFYENGSGLGRCRFSFEAGVLIEIMHGFGCGMTGSGR